MKAEVERLGVRFENRSITSVDDVDADLVIVAAGLRGGELLGDDTSVYPVRGQVVRMTNPELTEWVTDVDDPNRVTYVFPREDDVVVGSAKMGPNRPGRGSHVATGSFLVAPEARGRGVGRALGEHLVDWARAEGYRGIQFNAVVEANRAAVHLWQALGFRIVGTVPGAFRHPEHGDVGLHVMHLPLDR